MQRGTARRTAPNKQLSAAVQGPRTLTRCWLRQMLANPALTPQTDPSQHCCCCRTLLLLLLLLVPLQSAAAAAYNSHCTSTCTASASARQTPPRPRPPQSYIAAAAALLPPPRDLHTLCLCQAGCCPFQSATVAGGGDSEKHIPLLTCTYSASARLAAGL